MRGTRVRLYPQEGFAEPVVVVLNPPAGSVGPGPEDATLRTVLPVDKRRPYEPPDYMPPYRGALLPPAAPDACGDFTHIPVGTPQFLAQHLYGGIRCTLDVWEGYLGRPVTWWHAPEWPQLELVPRLHWNNAHAGPGFIETGVRTTATGEPRQFALNLDVIAHETGHAILFGVVGVPDLQGLTAGYLAFQESFSDLIALVTALSLPPIVELMLDETRGNLYVLNVVSRIGELSHVEQIRVADNETTIGDIADLRLTEAGEWIDPSGLERTVHHASMPLTGAIFDVLVDLFQDNLVRKGVLPGRLDARGWDEADVAAAFQWLEAGAYDALSAHRDDFRRALADARDTIGLCMARTMATIEPANLTFDGVAAAMMLAAHDLGLDRIEPAFLENFLWRGIDPRPLLGAPARRRVGWGGTSYAERRRRIERLAEIHRRRQPSPEVYMMAGRMMPHPQRTLETPA